MLASLELQFAVGVQFRSLHQQRGGKHPGRADRHRPGDLLSRAGTFRRRQVVRRVCRAVQHRLRSSNSVEPQIRRNRIRALGHPLRRLRQDAGPGRHGSQPVDERRDRQGSAVLFGQERRPADGDHLRRREHERHHGRHVLRDRLRARHRNAPPGDRRAATRLSGVGSRPAVSGDRISAEASAAARPPSLSRTFNEPTLSPRVRSRSTGTIHSGEKRSRFK